jgi:hypothetical protein
MPAVIIRYKLKPGVAPADFEHWVRTVDQPTLRGLARVAAFDTFRIERLLMDAPDGAEPSAHYIELFHIPDLDGFMAEDMAGETMQAVMAQFSGFTEPPEFLVAEKL